MHLTDEQAAQRAADHENCLAEFGTRKRNNAILNWCVLGVMVYVAAYEIIKSGVL